MAILLSLPPVMAGCKKLSSAYMRNDNIYSEHRPFHEKKKKKQLQRWQVKFGLENTGLN
jgi:hypothetical protein